MTAVATAPFRSPYELRLALVTAELSKSTDIPDAAAASLAEKVLRALDHIPERIR